MKCSGKVLIASSLSISAVGVLIWNLSKRFQKKLTSSVPGLLNVGNTCFMNSVLQCLASQTNFMQSLEKVTTNKSNLLSDSLHGILLKLCKKSNEYYDPSELLVDMMARGWHIPQEEHDAHEFFNALLTTIDEELKFTIESSPLSILLKDETKQLKTVKLKSISYRGLLSVKLQCISCGHSNPIAYECFDCLSVPIPTLSRWKLDAVSIYDCLEVLIGNELVSDVTCVQCSNIESVEKENTSKSTSASQLLDEIRKCNLKFPKLHTNIKMVKERNTHVRCSFQKQSFIAKLPQSLCIHLQRLVWKHGTPFKLAAFVKFPPILDIQKFRCNYQHKSVLNSCTYLLTGVIVHIGAWGFQGHYVAYRRFTFKNHNGNVTYQWYYTSDTDVRKVTLNEVLSCPAYMLFYDRIQME